MGVSIQFILIAACILTTGFYLLTFRQGLVDTQSQAPFNDLLKQVQKLSYSEKTQHNQILGALGTISPPALPSIRITGSEAEDAARKRKFYGGAGDKLHLGGFKVYDNMGISNNTWNFMMGVLGVKSVVDLGCGRGFSTEYFLSRGATVLCLEGSHDAVLRSVLPTDRVVEHDFTRGPWWPARTFDALWSVEFLEHVGRQYIRNYLPVMRRSALLFVTCSNNGGWHHVEVRESWWWRGRFEAAGFLYSQDLTTLVRNAAAATSARGSGLRIVKRMMVFINPAVASLFEHEHLFSGDGCLFNQFRGVSCDERFKWFSEVDVLPEAHVPLIQCSFNSTSRRPELHPGWGVYRCHRTPQGQKKIRKDLR